MARETAQQPLSIEPEFTLRTDMPIESLPSHSEQATEFFHIRFRLAHGGDGSLQ